MKPLRIKVTRVGGSAAIQIPLTLVKMYEWAPGSEIKARLKEGGALFDRDVREFYGGKSAGILIPKEVLDSHGLTIGDDVDVPFHTWVTVKPVAWPMESQPSRSRKKPGKKK